MRARICVCVRACARSIRVLASPEYYEGHAHESGKISPLFDVTHSRPDEAQENLQHKSSGLVLPFTRNALSAHARPDSRGCVTFRTENVHVWAFVLYCASCQRHGYTDWARDIHACGKSTPVAPAFVSISAACCSAPAAVADLSLESAHWSKFCSLSPLRVSSMSTCNAVERRTAQSVRTPGTGNLIARECGAGKSPPLPRYRGTPQACSNCRRSSSSCRTCQRSY